MSDERHDGRMAATFVELKLPIFDCLRCKSSSIGRAAEIRMSRYKSAGNPYEVLNALPPEHWATFTTHEPGSRAPWHLCAQCQSAVLAFVNGKIPGAEGSR